ncbi:hypothetical protein GCM10009533_62840 [Saccharopolyspora spinosporotrichia]|uniref:Uncharacterized protein n=1 Tax=Saccharopolyspora erythraea TaxID=1836 RepID=A0ABP3P520_SACER
MTANPDDPSLGLEQVLVGILRSEHGNRLPRLAVYWKRFCMNVMTDSAAPRRLSRIPVTVALA